MIDVKELRVGNWVQNDIDYKWQLETIGQIADQFYEENSTRVEMFPIPLSPEVLKACGFVFNNGDAQKFESEFVDLVKSTDYPGKFIVLGIVKQTGDKKCLYVEYLHQLQNLCFVFSGKELAYQPL